MSAAATARFPPPLRDRVPAGSVLGVDPSHDMIAFASSRFATVPARRGGSARPNLRFEVADARRLPYPAAFDLVVSFNALHWVPQQEEALRSIRATLAPGGQAVLRFVPQGPRQSLEDVIEETRRTARWAASFEDFETPFVHFTAEEYRGLAGQAGFRVVRQNVEDKAWDFQTRDGFTELRQDSSSLAWSWRAS